MFELSVARKYLTPRWRQLSVSIISLISILVIALVVWLIVVFFSVTQGLEKSWINKLIALTAPIRVLPTDTYYQSYYYQIDSISSSSDYNYKSIGEKLNSSLSDPYDPSLDAEIPLQWPKADLAEEGILKDPVKEAFNAIYGVAKENGIKARDFEMAPSTMHLQLLRKTAKNGAFEKEQYTEASLNQASYVGSFDPLNLNLSKTLLPLSEQDLGNILMQSEVGLVPGQEEAAQTLSIVPADSLRGRLDTFFKYVNISQLKVPADGWKLPKSIYPSQGSLEALVLFKKNKIWKVVIPEKNTQTLQKRLLQEKILFEVGQVNFRDSTAFLKIKNTPEAPLQSISLWVLEDLRLESRLENSSLQKIEKIKDLIFEVSFRLQNVSFQGKVPLGNLQIATSDITTQLDEEPATTPLWIHTLKSTQEQLILPRDPLLGDGILLPKSFKEAGVLVGDRGYLSYIVPTASSMQEQRAKVFVAGFYDPGIIPLGGKFILANDLLTNLIRASNGSEQNAYSNGINVHFSSIEQAERIKGLLQKALAAKGVGPYWKVETYREFDFTKDLIQQLRSEKNLFTLLATIIIIVACSNIISMLIILVNDKKSEIGILRSMGASSQSIAAIFGICGVVMGFLGSFIGILAAIFTLKNLQVLINLISSIQGYEMFNPHFYGETLPAELSFETLGYVIVSTALISLIAGLVPAIKASLMRPSAILRAE